MPVRRIGRGDRIDLVRGQIAVWLRGAEDAAEPLLASIPAEVPLVLSELPEAELLSLLAPADVVVLDPGCDVPDGWLPRLAAAAAADTNIATASPLTSADIAAAGLDLGPLAEQLATASPRLRPRLPRPRPGCVYVRRDALELAGPLDAGFADRCLAAGLGHVLADDVLVAPAGAGAGARAGARASSGELRAGPGEPLQRSLAAARRLRRRLDLVIDARLNQPQATGTLVAVRELLAALAGREDVAIRVLADEHARRALDGTAGVEVVSESAVRAAPGALVHRPLQVFGEWELATLPRLGERVVLTHHDLIAYRNPAYFPSAEEWQGFRAITRRALALADHVVFPSAHARADALAEDLVAPERASAVANGVDHVAPVAPVPPRDAKRLEGRELILCLGADYAHKNRPFALDVMAALRREHGWDGELVLAGPAVAHGGSRAAERERLAVDPDLAAHVHDLGPVGEAEKEWLYAHAAAVIYPTTYEGFGLIPFEAARHGVPCLWAPVTSLRGLLGPGAPLTMWDAAAGAVAAIAVLRDRAAAEANVARVRAAAAELTWERAAAELVEVYSRTVAAPPSPAAAVAALAPAAGLSEDGLRLLGPGRMLPVELERPLLALSSHPALGRPLFGALRAGYRLARAAGRRR